MLKRIKWAFINKFIIHNQLLFRTLLHENKKGHPLKAAALGICTAPFSRTLTIKNAFLALPREYYEEIHELLHLAKIDGVELVRIGKDNDGGYIMPDDFSSDDKIAYSFGISNDVSWDKGMASRGYDVFMYDHTIDGLPEENPRFHWTKLGIADGYIQNDMLKTLDELIKANHHEDKHNMILKMDVEGAEWGFLEMVSSDMLAQFSQILIEFHGINDLGFQEKVLTALRKLNLTHKAVHIHSQNVGQHISLGAQTFSNQIEVSYVRRDKYSLDDSYDPVLPLNIDMPALLHIPEICLGRWNRKITPADKFSAISLIL